MKKQTLAMVVILLVAGCSLDKPTAYPKKQCYATENGCVEFVFPAGWYVDKEEDSSYDLDCVSRDGDMTTGVFHFAKEDLAEDVTPRKLFQLQIDEVGSDRKNFKIKEKEQVMQKGGKKLTSVVYSGDMDVSRHYYRFTLIEFDEDPETIVILLQLATPSKWAKHKPVLEQIAKTARLKKMNQQ